jgi:hypothetical protein
MWRRGDENELLVFDITEKIKNFSDVSLRIM